jgi:hypothetical protein
VKVSFGLITLKTDVAVGGSIMLKLLGRNIVKVSFGLISLKIASNDRVQRH